MENHTIFFFFCVALFHVKMGVLGRGEGQEQGRLLMKLLEAPLSCRLRLPPPYRRWCVFLALRRSSLDAHMRGTSGRIFWQRFTRWR